MIIKKTIKTPCIGICSTGIGDDVCRGCKRFKHEVIDWNAYSYGDKANIENRLVGFLTGIIQNKLEIVDEERLRWQLDVQPIDVPSHRNLYCQLLTLLRAGASQIQQPEQFGFRVLPECQHQSLKQLAEDIDQEFYALSVAHYERYFQHFA